MLWSSTLWLRSTCGSVVLRPTCTTLCLVEHAKTSGYVRESLAREAMRNLLDGMPFGKKIARNIVREALQVKKSAIFGARLTSGQLYETGLRIAIRRREQMLLAFGLQVCQPVFIVAITAILSSTVLSAQRATLIPILASLPFSYAATYLTARVYTRVSRPIMGPFAVVRKAYISARFVYSISQDADWWEANSALRSALTTASRTSFPLAQTVKAPVTPSAKIRLGRLVRKRTRRSLKVSSVEIPRILAFLNGRKGARNWGPCETLGKRLLWVEHNLEDCQRREHAIEVLAATIKQCVGDDACLPPRLPKLPFGRVSDGVLHTSIWSRLRDVPGNSLLLGMITLFGAILTLVGKLR